MCCSGNAVMVLDLVPYLVWGISSSISLKNSFFSLYAWRDGFKREQGSREGDRYVCKSVEPV